MRGEIRTTVEYLVQLLETEEFKANTIDTAWLDGILKEKSVSVSQEPHLVVTSAAIYRAFQHVNTETASMFGALSKGQTAMSAISAMNEFPVEIAFKDVKYNFDIRRTAPNVFNLRINGQSIDVALRETPEGALLAEFGGMVHTIMGFDEPLGLRLSLDGATTLMPAIFDPSELRTDVTGKIVRYLQEPGTEVAAGEPFIEVEAMKMIMPIKATESGTITHAKSSGSIISAGDLLATLTLKDPSKVKKIIAHEGPLEIDEVEGDATPAELVTHALSGFKQDVEQIVAASMTPFTDLESAATFVSNTIESYLAVENMFEGRILDDVVLDMIKANKDSLDKVISANMAHQQLDMRNRLVLALLRQVETFSDRYGASALPESLMSSLNKLAQLKGKEYGEITLSAGHIIRQSKVPSFEDRKNELRTLLTSGMDRAEIAKSATLSAGVDLLFALFDDDSSSAVEESVRAAALEVYVRRVYRAHNIIDISVQNIDGRLTTNWKFQFADTPAEVSPVRIGQMSVVKDIDTLKAAMPQIIEGMKGVVAGEVNIAGDVLLNVFHFAVTNSKSASDDANAAAYEEIFTSHASGLKELKIRTANVLIPAVPKNPEYFSYGSTEGYKEVSLKANAPASQHPPCFCTH